MQWLASQFSLTSLKQRKHIRRLKKLLKLGLELSKTRITTGNHHLRGRNVGGIRSLNERDQRSLEHLLKSKCGKTTVELRLIREKGFNLLGNPKIVLEGHMVWWVQICPVPEWWVKRGDDDLGLLQMIWSRFSNIHTVVTRYSTLELFGGGRWCMWPLKWSFFFI